MTLDPSNPRPDAAPAGPALPVAGGPVKPPVPGVRRRGRPPRPMPAKIQAQDLEGFKRLN